MYHDIPSILEGMILNPRTNMIIVEFDLARRQRTKVSTVEGSALDTVIH